MFDDKPIGHVGQTPQNLPLGEPEDVFADTKEFVPVSPEQGSSTSALDAGILKPRDAFGSASPSAPLPSLTPIHIGANSGSPTSAPQSNNPQMDETVLPPMNTLKEPTMSRGIMVAIIVILGILLVGGAAWWVFQYLNVPETSTVEETVPEVVPAPPEPTLPVLDETQKPVTDSGNTEVIPVDDTSTLGDVETTSTQNVDQSILFGESPDTDVDGLDDKKEATLGTDPLKNDTDGDGLSDGDEVLIWGTDPLKADTDGDTYSDGNEVKAGYNPKGSGKLFEVKSTSTSTLN